VFNLFGKKKGPIKPIYTADNPIFKLIPLETAVQEQLFTHIKKQIAEKLNPELTTELLQLQSEHPVLLRHHKRLQFDSLGWETMEAKGDVKVFASKETGNYLLASQALPAGDLKDFDMQEELLIYQNWMREQFVHGEGGLLHCEIVKTDQVEGYESIAKIPIEGQEGMTYMYFLSLQNIKDNKLEQLRLTMRELGGAGLRDEMVRNALLEYYEKDPNTVYKYFRQDPYEESYSEGSVRSFAELAIFDELFPFHPLSVLRQTLIPRLLASLSYLEEIPVGEDSGDEDEIEFEEL